MQRVATGDPVRRILFKLLVATSVFGATSSMAAQEPVSRAGVMSAADRECPYVRCALGITPVWNGLAVVRGPSAERVTMLGFFWARPLPPVFAVHDSAARYAARAVRMRRAGSVLTDGGALLLAVGAVKAVSGGRVNRLDRLLLSTGATALAVSVPFQFAADGHLSRAVWWYNATLR